MTAAPSPENSYYAEHVEKLARSYRRWTGRDLIENLRSPSTLGEQAWNASFAIASHDGGTDPVFNYGNQTTLELFEMDWASFTRLPSRLSAEAPERTERERLLQQVTEHGFIDHYSGIRISATGRRFMIRNATVWNVVDDVGWRVGQAVRFDDWEPM